VLKCRPAGINHRRELKVPFRYQTKDRRWQLQRETDQANK